MQNHEYIPVAGVLDASKTSDIVRRVEEKEATGISNQMMKIKLQGVKGKPEFGVEIASTFHGSKNVDLEIEVSGANDVSAAIISAAGKPGSRIALMGSTFILNAGDPYEGGTKASDLEEVDKVVYQTLSALTGRRKYILDAIVKGGPISVKESKKCGIIDSVAGFTSKYLIPKVQKSAVTSATPVAPATPASQEISTGAIQTSITESAPKKRGRKKSTSA